MATRRGLTYKPSDIRKNGVRVLRSSNIAEDSFVLSDEDVFVVREAVNIDCVRANDILITAANGSSRLVGKHTIISGIPEESAVHGGFMLLGTTKEPHFVNASMGSSWYRRFIELFVAGGNGAIGNLNKNDLDNQDIAIPSEKEQKKIGSFFRQLDNLITLHQRQPFLHSTPEISLTVQLIHPFYTSSWEQRKFSELVQIERGGSPRPIDYFITDAPNGLNWVKIGDAPTQGNYITKTAEKIRPEGLSKTREVHPGDLILSNSMSFGKPYILGIDGCIHDGWLLIRNTYGVFDLTFLCHLLGTPQMLSQYRSLAAGSTVNNLNKELVGNTYVTIPSITEQRVLGAYLEQLDNLITLHQRKGKAAVTGCSNDANNSKGVYCKARDFGYKCCKKVESP